MRAPVDYPARPAAAIVIVGGLLAFAASFLPLVQISHPASPVYHEPAGAHLEIPAQTLATLLGVQMRHPYGMSLSGCLLFAGFWGAPLALAAIGLWLWLARRRMALRGAWITGLFLAVIGAGVTALDCAFFLIADRGGVIPSTVTLQYGLGVALLGYLAALAGLLWTATQRAK